MAQLNPDSSLPLYAQLAEQLLRQIRAGEFGVGSRIPSEHALSEKYGIGRPTVRQATEKLIQRGYLSRKRGAGTFVVERNPSIDLFSLGGTLSSFSRQGVQLVTRLVQKPQLVDVGEESTGRAGEHSMMGRQAYQLTRLGSVDTVPLLLERFWFDAGAFPSLDELDLAEGSLSEAIRVHYGVEASSAEQRFFVRRLELEDAELLGQEISAPVLHVERELHFSTAKSAVFAEMKCADSRFHFSQHIGGEHG